MVQVEVVTDTKAFHDLRSQWIALVDQCPTATIFQSFEWLYPWWTQLGSKRIDRKLNILVARTDDGAIVGIAPLMTSTWHGTPLRRLSFLGTGASDYNDLIALPDHAAAVSSAFYGHMARTANWHIADFAHLREGSLWREHPPRSGGVLNYSDFGLEKCPYLPYPATHDGNLWTALLKTYSKKMREHIGYYERKLRAVYEVENRYVTDPSELDDTLDALFELHRRRWNKRWLPGVLGGREVQSFHRTVARNFLGRDWLRLHYITLDGDFQAVLYCFAFKERTCYYQGGFEPTLAKLSLGSVLTATAIRTSTEEGRAEFDFLRGDEPYKERWTHGQSRLNIRRLIARAGTGHIALAEQAHRIESAIETRFKDFMHHAYTKEPAIKRKEGGKEGESDR